MTNMLIYKILKYLKLVCWREAPADKKLSLNDVVLEHKAHHGLDVNWLAGWDPLCIR